MRILLLGSSVLTRRVEFALERSGKWVVGHVPSVNPTVPGYMRSPVLPITAEAEMLLSVQYDRKVKDVDRAWNIHTGLLPEFGGCDVLYHTLKEGTTEQGLTFHKMTDRLDYGPIVSRVTYPVFEDDTILDLYARMLALVPGFAVGCVNLVEKGIRLDECEVSEPFMYRRGRVAPEDAEEYANMGRLLRETYG